MKTMTTLVTLLIIGITIFFLVLGYLSKSKTPPGLISGQLSTCPAKPNCVCSEETKETQHYVEPISYPNITNAEMVQNIITTLKAMNGSITTKTNTYIAATFTSSIFGFVDDFEIRLDSEKQLIHLRSASRVGHSDMGINKRRAETFKEKLTSAFPHS